VTEAEVILVAVNDQGLPVPIRPAPSSIEGLESATEP